MEFSNYIEKAMRTNPKGKSFKDNILNGLLGLFGEYTELLYCTENETKKELGDCYWYTALLFNTMEVECINLDTLVEIDALPTIGKLHEHFKKHFFQGHDLDRALVQVELSKVRHFLDLHTRVLTGCTPNDIWKLNIQKLIDRYPEGFESGKSINREED